MQAMTPSMSTTAETFNAYDRLPILSVMKPVAMGPSVCPIPKATVIIAIAFGHASRG
jgi:hypothetical protein